MGKASSRRRRRQIVADGPTAVPRVAAYPPYPGRRYVHLLSFIGMVAACVALFWSARNFGFLLLDDSAYVVENPWIRGLGQGNLLRILTEPYRANYSPAHLLSYVADYAVGGLDPRVYHVSSLLWAGLCAGFVYLLAVALTGRRVIGIAAGALFIVHPAHVEAVVWISSRKDLVSTAFAIPSILAWVEYRKAGRRGARMAWYTASLLLFAVALAGKLSVVVVPVILMALDFFIERRAGAALVLDKIPFAGIIPPFALPTMGAQPATGYSFDPFVIGQSFAKCCRLLSGFGDFVVLWPRPPAASGFEYLLVLLPVAALAAPLLLRRVLPGLALALWSWVVLALIPSQVLSFVHPVSERYLYFPSIGLVILIAWAVPRALEQRAPAGRWLAVSLVVLLTGAWMANTFAYLSEWEEPRSVWYAAVRKSDDPNLYLYLGSHYQDMAGILSKPAVLTGDQKTELTRLAEAEWRGDERLPALLREWAAQSYAGPQSLAFGAHLRSVAWTQYETCLRVKGGRVLHNLFFRRGMILVDSKNWLAARAEFQQAYEESRLLAFAPARDDMAIRCHFALGIVAANLGERDEALRMFVLADEEQRRFGQVVEPRIETALQQLRKNRP